MKIEKSNISTVQRGRIVGANFRTRQIRQTPTTPEIACPPGFFQNWNWFLMILVVQIYWVDVLMDTLKMLMRAYTAWSGVDVQRPSHLECSRFSSQCLQLSVNSIQKQNSTLAFWNQWTSPQVLIQHFIARNWTSNVSVLRNLGICAISRLRRQSWDCVTRVRNLEIA